MQSFYKRSNGIIKIIIMNLPGDDFLKEKTIVEICVDSLQSAIAAEKGGAHRVELCANLMAGGTTPNLGLIELVRENLSIDVNVMIRPRPGEFCYSNLEIAVMKRDIEIIKKTGVNGIVVGVLKPNGDINKETLEELIEVAKPLPITFHRAFDMVRDPYESLDILIDLGVERVLTSGKENIAIDGIDLIKELVDKSKDNIIIMPGSGINEENVKHLILNTGVREIHLSAKKKVSSNMDYRNNKVNMGINTVLSEYDNYFTCEESVRAINMKLNKII